METTTTPVITKNAQAYRTALAEYNKVTDELNTSFGGKRMSAYSHDSVASVEEALKNAQAFANQRQEQLSRLATLTFEIQIFLAAGAAEELAAYETALWASTN